MVFSVLSLELTMNLSTKQFSKFKKLNAIKTAGIKIDCKDNRRKVILDITPAELFKCGGADKLWKPKKDNIEELRELLKKFIAETFGSSFKLNDFKITAITFAVNIEAGENVAAYIKVLRKIGKAKGFTPKRAKDGRDEKASFDLEGNSNGITFSVCDCHAETGDKSAKGILRVEVKLAKPNAIGRYTPEQSTSKQITELAGCGKDILLDTFVRIVPFGDYHKLKEAEKLIETNIRKKVHKAKMLRLLRLIPEKKSLFEAQKEMNDRNMGKLMLRFAEIGLNPITISKRHDTKFLQNLHDFVIGQIAVNI
ncbi:MAG: hypothetical protein LBT84_07035 [Spirochaetia bacterium]|jgi:hypothetical protein|nr:hypothetical protein [Spirochaetia bacterium]